MIVITVESRYQSWAAEAEARNPVYITVEQDALATPSRDGPGEPRGPVESSVEGLRERQRAVDGSQ